MTTDQLLILSILFATVVMFMYGRWRHDMVAIAALLACVFSGLVPSQSAFAGFGHPAVITVACVLVLSRGLQLSGAVGALTRTLLPGQAGITLSMAALLGLGALLSSFMNNVGAMALLMPVAMQVAGRLKLTPGQVLMPLAFGTILGGMTTLIGTPPNVIVSGFRAQSGASNFGMFDFSPIGLAVAVSGIVVIIFFGWRLVPVRQQAGVEGFESGAYITEARVEPDSKVVGMTLSDIEIMLEDADARVIGMVHKDIRLTAPSMWRKVRAGDILVLEAEASALADALSALNLKLEEAVPPESAAAAAADTAEVSTETNDTDNGNRNDLNSVTGDPLLMELVVLPGSALDGRSVSDIMLRSRYGLNLLALSRQGELAMKRLRAIRLRPGDLMLMQGAAEVITAFAADNGCVPLAERELRIPNRRKAWQAGIILALAVSSVAFGLLSAAVAFAAGVLASMVLRTVPLRQVYEAIDLPIIVLLGALIPVAGAMESTGTADLIARFAIDNMAQGNAVLGLALILVVTMFLSDLMNNAATAAVMCPIALGVATALNVSADSFLMAVAIGASCSFLTPIGHQNNTMILGPGGFHFGDYWRLGLLIEIVVVLVSMPLLLWVWPL